MKNNSKNVRKSVLAGYWYPKEEKDLKNLIDSFLIDSMNDKRDLKALVVPHAGYKYSGSVAGEGFSRINKCYNKVFVLGSSHKKAFDGLSVPDYSYYETPLGKIALDDLCYQIKEENKIVKTINQAHLSEHSIEIQLPFIIRLFERNNCDSKIVPLLFGRVNTDISSKIIQNYLDDNSLLIVSADLSHFLTDDEARKIDNKTIESILSLNEINRENSTCNPYGINTLIKIANNLNWKPELIKYQNSSKITNDESRVVGYTSIAFY